MSSVKITLFQGKFRLDRLLGKGGFGEVYAGVQVSTGEPVAVKLERNKGRCFLFHEARVMQDIQNSMPGRTTPGIPELKYFGQEGDFRILIMSLLGPSLEDLHAKLGRFSLKTTVMLADEMLSRLEFIHSVGYIHRDLKPDNYLLGVGRNVRHLYLIDLGLSVRYRSTNGEHREMATGKSFVGTSRYASLRTHKGFSQSRRDDMEQLSYILIYLYRGHLPWSGLRMKDREAKEKAIGEIKQKLTTAQICSKCPSQFEDLLNYSRKLEFAESPQYEMCRILIASVLDTIGPNVKHDFQYDWVSVRKRDNSPPPPPPCIVTHERRATENKINLKKGNENGEKDAATIGSKIFCFFPGLSSSASQEMVLVNEK
ncbi:protein kinase, putative,casein kinase I, putative [Trypanosoma cruzi]|uniref:non-specific serine/threonine protein kinase n=2 Tax=Trypanosoma cruzi TaxID=5693 RepID=V5AIW9_TRYCR|nr:protein kinase, putative,casein kinase I, putative [Trypanosoma cruzi]ESS60565.1 protein kinase [Trypanosoma cruzi Dm28c]PBJ75255.1 protein kinase,casein kinase I [Trypanosoma cruzi cruzi]PBJ76101.1 protein kinase,casein kinase I [Trypanosoma cruzi cruzi]PWU88122.1 putative casein kinase I [Trypanosoma cruzi]